MQTTKRILLCLLAGLLVLCLAACGGQADKDDDITLYLFSGESDEFVLEKGVVVLTGEKDIIYSGQFHSKEPLEVVDYIASYYISTAESEVLLLSNGFSDGSGSGPALDLSKYYVSLTRSPAVSLAEYPDEFANNFYLQIDLTTVDGEKTTYKVPLQVEKVYGTDSSSAEEAATV